MTRLVPLMAALMALTCALPALADEPGAVTIQKPPVTGEEVYRQICQSCHMAGALGGAGAATIPALAHNPRLATPDFVVITVLKGRGAMPWFDDLLDPAQIAAVATYVRTHFGNAYPAPVTVAQVKALAAK